MIRTSFRSSTRHLSDAESPKRGNPYLLIQEFVVWYTEHAGIYHFLGWAGNAAGPAHRPRNLGSLAETDRPPLPDDVLFRPSTVPARREIRALTPIARAWPSCPRRAAHRLARLTIGRRRVRRDAAVLALRKATRPPNRNRPLQPDRDVGVCSAMQRLYIPRIAACSASCRRCAQSRSRLLI